MRSASLYILFICLQFVALAQEPQDSLPVLLDTLPRLSDSILDTNDLRTINDTMRLYLDSLLASEDSSILSPPLPYEISPDAVNDPVDYDSRDSSWMDNINKIVHLYGKAYVKYTNLEVRAPYIQFNVENNIAVAFAMPDSTGEGLEKANFSDGKLSFESEKMSYNFRTKKGVVHAITTKEKDIVVHSEVTKFFGKNAEGYNNKEELPFLVRCIIYHL